jgi:predicted glycoside hydrolase/deacetylase ChbG (UPF0249 family)
VSAMNPTRQLIVNADDFGLSPGINQGIIQAREQGIVTSASLMVRHSAAHEAAAYARMQPEFSVGLHVDLCEWIFSNDEWRPAYEVVPVNDPERVETEITRQMETFRHLTGRDPTHLDSHQHVHRSEPMRSILLAHARRLNVVLRGENPGVRYCGEFYGQSNKGDPYPEGITVESLLKIIGSLPAGTTELCCHPGLGSDADTVYQKEREIECQTLCDPLVRNALDTHGIALCSFKNAGAGAGH